MERTPGNGRLWEEAQSVAGDLGFEIADDGAGGGSDGNTTSRWAPTLDGLGAVGDGAHAEHEHVVLDAMVERTALLAGLLMRPPLRPSPARSDP
jgi:glutamate carboxypeptidase